LQFNILWVMTHENYSILERNPGLLLTVHLYLLDFRVLLVLDSRMIL